MNEGIVFSSKDVARAHIAATSLLAIADVFDERIITEELWPARSPDLTPCDFYL